MAQTSGRITLTNANNQKLHFDWDITNQNYYTKQTTISWSIMASAGNDEDITLQYFYLEIDGVIKVGEPREATVEAGELYEYGKFTIQHPNRSRAYDVDFDVSCELLDGTVFNEYSESESYTIPKIGTFPTLEATFEETSETSIRATCEFSAGYDYLSVSLWRGNDRIAEQHISDGSSDTIVFDFSGLEARYNV